MNVRFDIKQGTPEWLAARAGVVTASEADALVSPTGKVRTGDGVKTYLYRKVAEKLLGVSAPEESRWFQSSAMSQGQIRERYAVPFLEMMTNKLIEVPGIVLSDDGRCGCSPDGIFKGEQCGLEIKCPEAHTHVGYLAGGVLPSDYIAQLQFSLYVTGWPQWTFLSWHPKLPPLILTVTPDEAYQQAIQAALAAFLPAMDAAVSKIEALQKAA